MTVPDCIAWRDDLGKKMVDETVKFVAKSLANNNNAEPVAFVIAEDGFGLKETLAHLTDLGFSQIVVLSDRAELAGLAVVPNSATISIHCDPLPSLESFANSIIPVLENRWLHFCYNGEFLFFPYSENRSVFDVIAFSQEERRDAIFGYTLDLYHDRFPAGTDMIDRENVYFDSTGYYSESSASTNEAGDVVNVFGGLRWRYAQHLMQNRPSINRVCMFKAVPDLKMASDGYFNVPEYNTISSQWHRSVTMAVMSFRAAKALATNPLSKADAATLRWKMSKRFEWNSRQLMEAGFIETGQWF